MNKVNFNSIMTLPTPESWIDNALAIPEKEENKPAVIRLRPRIIAAAAVLVVVTAVSAALFLSMGGRDPIEIKPSIQDGTVPPTEYYAGSDPTSAVSPSENGGQQPTQSGTSPTENAAAQAGRTISELLTQPTQSATAASSSPTSSASPTQAPTTKPTQSATVKPTERPTQTATEAATQKPTQAATVKPTQAPTQKPTAKPTEVTWEPPTESPWVPTEQASHNATETATEPPQLVLSSVTISKALYVRNGSAVYCKITDTEGNLYGDNDLFSDGHLATQVSASMNTVTCEYRPGDHGIMLWSGTVYNYTFYDSDGRMLAKGVFRNS